MKLSLRLCLPLLVAVPLMALAQPKKPTSPPQLVAPANDPDQVNVYAGSLTYLDDEQGVAHLTKNVVITQKSQNLTVYAQDAVYNKAQNKANASTQLAITTRNSTVRGLRLNADFAARRFVVSGSVVITSHGKNDGEAGRLKADSGKHPVRVDCDQVVWEYDTQQATATGDIRITQGTNRGTCNKIIYDEKNNIVWLQGNVRFGNDKSQSFITQDLKVYLDTNMVVSGQGRVTFPNKGDLDNPDAKATPAPKKTAIPIPVSPLPFRMNAAGGIEPLPPAATPVPTATEEPLPPPPTDEPDEEKPNTK